MLQDGGHTALRSDPPPSIALAQGATFHSDWGGNIAARTSKLRQQAGATSGLAEMFRFVG